MKCIFNLILSMTLGIFMLFSSNLKDFYYRNVVGSNVVRVYNVEKTSGGTGFHVKAASGKIFILTNKHVCELADKNDRVLIEQNGQAKIKKVVARYEHHDLCLVEPIQEERFIDVADSSHNGEDIIVVGHPGLRRLTLAHGEFIGPEIIQLAMLVDSALQCKGRIIEDPMVQFFYNKLVCVEQFRSSAISSPIYGGNSGSPVLNIWGNVIGVVFAGNRSQANDGYMVPLNYVKDFLKGF